ncbi:MAG: MFS transporter [Oligoflexia bacterium]|nr:MFS transporter [Oligoflexia bacterium]
MSTQTQKTWIDSAKDFLDIRAITMLFFGFSAGLPLLLIFSSLSLWLREAGVDRSTVTFFSWAALPYSFKFVWSPLVDKLPIPILSKAMGRRRSWLLVSQLLIILAIVLMAFIDPASSNRNLTFMALAAVLLGFSSATQDIGIDAFRIESAQSELQAILASTYVAGYRIAMIVAGAGSLFIAESFGSTSESYSHSAWMNAYLIMAACMLIGVFTTLIRPEPKVKVKTYNHSNRAYAIFFFLVLIVASCFASTFYFCGSLAETYTNLLAPIVHNKVLAEFIIGFIRFFLSIGVAAIVAFGIKKTALVNTDLLEEGYIDPIKNFFERYGRSLAILLLAVVGLYRISDIVLGVISNVFYGDMGFSKTQIASAVKTYGVLMSILGGFIGGILTTKLGVIRMLWWGALLSAATNLLFMVMAKTGNDPFMLYTVVSADNLAAGFASAAFVAFLSSLTDISFTAIQYAIFTSLMTLFPKILGGYSGSIVDSIGYQWFFAFTTILGIPVLYLVHLCGKKFSIQEKRSK